MFYSFLFFFLCFCLLLCFLFGLFFSKTVEGRSVFG